MEELATDRGTTTVVVAVAAVEIIVVAMNGIATMVDITVTTTVRAVVRVEEHQMLLEAAAGTTPVIVGEM